MRISRQPRCTAAISVTAAAKARKAAGRKPQFELNDPSGVIAGRAALAAQTPSMAPS
jgi:hypothetical protein